LDTGSVLERDDRVGDDFWRSDLDRWVVVVGSTAAAGGQSGGWFAWTK
jgi:hypothetical protein